MGIVSIDWAVLNHIKIKYKILNYLTDKGLAGFSKKLNLWKNSINNYYSRFPAIPEFPEDTDLEVEDNENSVFVKYLSKLTVYIDEYHPANNIKPIKWVSTIKLIQQRNELVSISEWRRVSN